MRVALDASPIRAPLGGVGHYALGLALSLPAEGVEVVLVTNRPRALQEFARRRGHTSEGAQGVAGYAADLEEGARAPEVAGRNAADLDEGARAPEVAGRFAADLDEGARAPEVATGSTFRPTLLWLQLAAMRAARRAGAEVFHATTGRGQQHGNSLAGRVGKSLAPRDGGPEKRARQSGGTDARASGGTGARARQSGGTDARARSAPLPTVVTVHDLTILTHPHFYAFRERLLVAPWLRRSIRQAAAVICVSQSTRRECEALLGPLRAPVHVIPEAADGAFHDPIAPERIRGALDAVRPGSGAAWRQGFGGSAAPIWLFVGSMTPRKNPVGLVEAFARALPALDGTDRDATGATAHSSGASRSILGPGAPSTVRPRAAAVDASTLPHLVMVGPGGPLDGAVSAAIRRLGLDALVTRPGWVEDLPALMAGSELLACPSLHEGFGLVVAEAMATGLPVVAAHRGGLPELVREAGLLCEPDPGSLAQTMVRLANDAGLRERLRTAGLEQSRGLTWARAARATASAYRQASDLHRPLAHS